MTCLPGLRTRQAEVDELHAQMQAATQNATMWQANASRASQTANARVATSLLRALSEARCCAAALFCCRDVPSCHQHPMRCTKIPMRCTTSLLLVTVILFLWRFLTSILRKIRKALLDVVGMGSLA